MLWVAVENNEYELPLAVAETAKELAIRTDSVRRIYSMHKTGKSKRYLKYKIIKVDDKVVESG